MRKILKNIRNVHDVRKLSTVQKNVKLQIGRFINILVIRRKNSHLVYMVYLFLFVCSTHNSIQIYYNNLPLKNRSQ